MYCISKKPIRAILAFIAIFFGLSRVANAQIFTRLAYSPGNTSSGYSILNLKDNSIYFTAEYNSNFIKIFSAEANTEIFDQRLSPNGKYIAVIARDLERKYPFVDVLEEYRNTTFIHGKDVLILDTKGEVLIKLEPDYLLGLDWNPEGDKLICVTGDYEKNPVKSEWLPGDALSIYDVASKEKISSHVAPQNEYYWNVAWAEHDGNIYIELSVKKEYGFYSGIFRYDYKTSELVPTPLNALNISPDGKYCFHDIVNHVKNGHIGLYSTSTGNETRFIVPDRILTWNNVSDQVNYRIFTHQLKHLSWIIEGGKTYAVLYNLAPSAFLAKMGISGFWKVDCETGVFEELAAPKGISTYYKSRNDYQMPAGLENGKLIWAVPNDSGGLKASALDQ